MAKEIEFDLIGIADAISRYKFRVPSNQREYSWVAENQVKDFLLDIANALRSPDKAYFLGTVVLTSGEDDRFEIADGQQRLATTTMLIAAMRDWFRSKGENQIYKALETEYLFKYDLNAREDVSKLILNVDDNEYFKSKILHEFKSKLDSNALRSHKLIAQAAEHIRKYIADMETTNSKEYTSDRLIDWLTYLKKNARIVLLKVEDAENAFMMFETLNDRGLKTSQVDLVKNYLFKLAGDRLPEAQSYWSSMKSAIESVSDDDEITIDFLRACCCLLYGLTTKKELMSRIREKVTGKTEAIQILKSIDELGKNFAAILNPDHPKWNEYSTDVRRSIQVINLFKSTQIRPLMLAIARSFNDKNTPLAFKRIVSWTIRFIVMGIRGGRLDEGYVRIAHEIYKGNIKTDEQLSVEAEKIAVNDSEFKIGFEKYRISNTKQARYFLRALELTAQNEEKPQFVPNDDSVVINLEHILPSSSSEHWTNFSSDDKYVYLTRLGNMVLLQADKNSNIGNLPFVEKKKEYAQSSYLLTSQIEQFDEWSIEAIEKRQKVLAELAVKTWPV